MTSPATGRIDVHHHYIDDAYRRLLTAAGITEAGGRPIPDWTPQTSLDLMDTHDIATAILSLSSPATTHEPDPAVAARHATSLNAAAAELVAAHPSRFGFFAHVPMGEARLAATVANQALSDHRADGIMLLANNHGRYLGEPGDDELWELLDDRHAVVFVHPHRLPSDDIDGIPPFATDFLLDTTRAAYLLVRTGIVERYPNIRFILSHGGGFVPYASHRMAAAIVADTGRPPLDVLEDLRSFWFDTALTASPAALPTLLAFARPERILYGSDWPYAPELAVAYFTAGLDHSDLIEPVQHAAIRRGNASALFPRLSSAQPPVGSP